MKLVVSCEHGGNRVPPPYAELFAGCEQTLAGHRGWDLGALWMARRIARAFDAPLHATTVTRLLVDANRSEHHPRLFSSWCAPLTREERGVVLDRYYRAHRNPLERRLQRLVDAGDSVLHLAVHSFTPRWRGRVRRCDIGLLYDPRRRAERALCRHWQGLLRARAPELRVRRNFPYRGVADGLTTHLRRQFRAGAYLGVELELNQRSIAHAGAPRRELTKHLESSLRELLVDR